MNKRLTRIDQQFFTGRPTQKIAQDLLGKRLIYDGPKGPVGGYIVETEAYLGEKDSAAHAYKGRRTPYTEPLYGPPGTIYIYPLHNQHLFDIAVQDENIPQGVLIRALEPHVGIDLMQENRPRKLAELTNGPGKLMQALGIQTTELNFQLVSEAALTIDCSANRIPKQIVQTARIGVSKKGYSHLAPYRYYVAGNPYVSGIRKKDIDQQNNGWKSKTDG